MFWTPPVAPCAIDAIFVHALDAYSVCQLDVQNAVSQGMCHTHCVQLRYLFTRSFKTYIVPYF